LSFPVSFFPLQTHFLPMFRPQDGPVGVQQGPPVEMQKEILPKHCVVHTSKRVVSYTLPPTGRKCFTLGTDQHTTDMSLAADGVRSTVRQQFFATLLTSVCSPLPAHARLRWRRPCVQSGGARSYTAASSPSRSFQAESRSGAQRSASTGSFVYVLPRACARHDASLTCAMALVLRLRPGTLGLVFPRRAPLFLTGHRPVCTLLVRHRDADYVNSSGSSQKRPGTVVEASGCMTRPRRSHGGIQDWDPEVQP